MFTPDDIIRELMNHGGRMPNMQLVLKFAPYLKNPDTKEEAKRLFKDYVNRVGTLVTDPGTQEKYVCLRPEYRPAAPPMKVLQPLPIVKAMAPPVPNVGGSRKGMCLVDGPPPSPSPVYPPVAGPQAPPPMTKQMRAHHSSPHHQHHQQAAQQQPRRPTSAAVPQQPPKAKPPPPDYNQAIASRMAMSPPNIPSMGVPSIGPPMPPAQRRGSNPPSIQQQTLSLPERRASIGSLNLPPQNAPVPPPRPPFRGSPQSTPTTPGSAPIGGPLPSSNSSSGSINPSLRSLSKSTPTLCDGDPPAVPARNRRHSTKGSKVEEKVRKFAQSGTQEDLRLIQSEKLEHTVSPGTVREKLEMLSRMTDLSTTKLSNKENGKENQLTPTNKRLLSSRNSNHDTDDKCSVSTLDPLQKEFCRKAMTCDYQAMHKLLLEDPNLAKSIDYVLGNALHWAAKYGNTDVVKLIAGTYNVDPNIRARGSGQTPLHIAYTFNQRSVIDLLIQTYGAQKDVRDFSGRKPDYYGSQKNLQSARQKIFSERNEQDKDVTPPRTLEKAFAKRYGSFNANIKKTLHHLNLKNWDYGSVLEEEGGTHSMPPPSRRRLPKKAKRTASLLSTMTGRSTHIAPPQSLEEKDSDSDSAYGFNA